MESRPSVQTQEYFAVSQAFVGNIVRTVFSNNPIYENVKELETTSRPNIPTRFSARIKNPNLLYHTYIYINLEGSQQGTLVKITIGPPLLPTQKRIISNENKKHYQLAQTFLLEIRTKLS